MEQAITKAFLDELGRISKHAAKIKSNFLSLQKPPGSRHKNRGGCT